MPKPDFWKNEKRYYDFKSYLRNRFGCNVYKLQIDAGFTCPNRDGSLGSGGCIYCDGRGSKLRRMGPLPDVAEQIERGKALYRKLRGAVKFIAYFQTFTNTYGPYERLKALYDEALSQEDIVGIAVGTRPDCVDGRIIDLFEFYAGHRHVWLEYGLQSMHAKTLRKINRGHDAETFRRAVIETAGRGINVCVHIILGLPGEAREEMMEKDEYVAAVCDTLEILPPEMVIQRLTADGYRDIYLAPEWGKKKLDVLNAIDRELEKRDTWQGAKHRGSGAGCP